MKITRLLTFAAAVLLAAMPATAADKTTDSAVERVRPSKTMRSESFEITDDYTRIELSAMVKMTIEERTDNTVVVRANDNLFEHIRLEVRNGVLRASLNKTLSFSGENKVSIEMFVPYNHRLSAVEVCGASVLTVKPTVKSERFDAEVYGAAVMSADIEAATCKAEVYGASVLTMNCTGGRLKLEASGASVVRGKVHVVKSDIEVSGASAVSLSGSSTGMTLEVSGASSFHGGSLDTEVCTAEVSGASAAEVNCSASLSAEASGASKLSYRGDCRLASCSTSGFSSVKRK